MKKLFLLVGLTGCEALLPGSQSSKPPSPLPTPNPQVVRIEVSGSGAVNVGGSGTIDVKQPAASTTCPCGCAIQDCQCGKAAQRVAAQAEDQRAVVYMATSYAPGQCEPCDRAEADLARIGGTLPFRVAKTSHRPAGLPLSSPVFYWTDSRGVIRYRAGYSSISDLTYSWGQTR